MKGGTQGWPWLGVVCFLSLGCGERSHDPNEQAIEQRVAISHLRTAPVGQLMIWEDKTYMALDFEAERISKSGTLSDSEFRALDVHASRAALSALFRYAEPIESTACDAGGPNYFLIASGGSGCMVPENISDSARREDFDFLVSLFLEQVRGP